MEWSKQKLTDIASFFEDGNWIESKDQSPKGYWLVQTGNVGVFSFRDKELKRFVSEETFNRLNCSEIYAGDILISRLPDPIGRACIVPNTDYKMLTAVDCTIIRLKKDYNLKYVNYLLNSEVSKRQVYQMITGSTRKRISRKNLGKVLLPIPFKNGKPNLEEQNRIANKLDKVFGKVDQSVNFLKKQIQKTNNIILSELRETFGGANMKTYPLGDICDTTSGGTPSRSRKDYYEGNIDWLKSGELNDNRNITSSEEHISDLALEKSNAKIYPSGTLLMAMYGATVGKLGILGVRASTNQAVCAIMPHRDILNEYIYWYLFFYRDELVRQAFGGAQPNISQTLIRKVPIKIPVIGDKPDLKEQARIVKKINAIEENTGKLTELFFGQKKSFISFRTSFLNKSFQIQA